MTSRVSAWTRRVRWAAAALLWMSVVLAGCSGGGEEYPWPWQDEEPPAPAANFVGMWDFDPARGYVDTGWQGFIVIEWPCVFMVEDIDDARSPPRRAAVKMPRRYTRYDPQTQSMWVSTEGPISTGDRHDSMRLDSGSVLTQTRTSGLHTATSGVASARRSELNSLAEWEPLE